MVSNQHLRIFFFFRLCLQHVKERLSREERESLLSLSRGNGVLQRQLRITFNERNASLLADCSASVVIFSVS